MTNEYRIAYRIVGHRNLPRAKATYPMRSRSVSADCSDCETFFLYEQRPLSPEISK
ncbi:Uncharacterised protein [Vibrio cholerae]|nr:Uncharacterised protein [Vibrio cholerae]